MSHLHCRKAISTHMSNTRCREEGETCVSRRKRAKREVARRSMTVCGRAGWIILSVVLVRDSVRTERAIGNAFKALVFNHDAPLTYNRESPCSDYLDRIYCISSSDYPQNSSKSHPKKAKLREPPPLSLTYHNSSTAASTSRTFCSTPHHPHRSNPTQFPAVENAGERRR